MNFARDRAKARISRGVSGPRLQRGQRLSVAENVLAVVLVALLLIGGCCHIPVDYGEFTQLSLDQQIAGWQRIRAATSFYCHIHQASWLWTIAEHGYPAADAVERFLLTPEETFPATDALHVLEGVHRYGCDLRTHPVMRTIRQVAESHSSDFTREMAVATLAKISRDPDGQFCPAPK